ncbi:MAG: hypothetical protein K2N89_14645 [Lachnospiraceae bacterium]|nr:hypothetical protein [Lachnospiraceae bacterium]
MYKKIENTYLGFTDNIREPQKTRTENTLDKLIRYDGNIYNMVTFLVGGLIEGRKPEKKENVQWYKKDGQLSRPRTEYRFLTLDGSQYWEMKKTYFDFCIYCMKNGLTTQDSVDDYIKKENDLKAEQMRIRQEEEQIAQDKARKEEAERLQMEDVIIQTLENLPETEKELMRRIFESVCGNANIAGLNYRLLALIHNYDNPLCRADIISRLHNGNRASIKTFEHVTGLTLPKAYKERRKYLENISSADFVGIKEFVPRKSNNQIG